MARVAVDSLVFAVLAKNVPGRFVRAAVPGDGSFTIHLNATVNSSTPVAYIVFDPSPD